MKNAKLFEIKVVDRIEANIEEINDIKEVEEMSLLNSNAISRIVYYLPGNERMRLIDLNTNFYEEIIKSYIYEFTHEWIDYDTKGIFMEGLLKRYSNNITKINIKNQKQIKLYNNVIELCENITDLNIEEGDINYLLCLAYSKWAKNIKCINIGEQNEERDLQQVPKFPKLETLILSNINVNSQYFKELFFFVPETITSLHLTELDYLDNNTVNLIMKKFPNITNLKLNSKKCKENVLTCMNTHFNKLTELSLGHIMQYNKSSSKLKILAKNIPRLKILKIYSKEGIREEESGILSLLKDNVYPMSTIYLINMNINVEYEFTSTNFPNLTKLYLDGCENLSINQFIFIFKNLNLTLLSLNQSNITDTHFEALIHCMKKAKFQSNVQTLSLKNNYPLGCHLLSCIVFFLSNLETLDVSHCKPYKQNIQDSMLSQFNFDKKLKLQHMKVKDSFIVGAILEMMVRVSPDLKTLLVDDIQLTNEFLKSKKISRNQLVVYTNSDW